MNIQLGRTKTVRRAYGIDEIALVPGGRTVDPEITKTNWEIGGIEREIPIIASAMDGVVDVNMAVALSKLGALGVLNLEGVQTRYEDPEEVLAKIQSIGKEEFVPLMQEIYKQPIKEELILKRILEIKKRGGISAVSGTPLAAIKYQFLRPKPEKPVKFNPEESVKLQGDTGPYLQYTNARINSLVKKTSVEPSGTH